MDFVDSAPPSIYGVVPIKAAHLNSQPHRLSIPHNNNVALLQSRQAIALSLIQNGFHLEGLAVGQMRLCDAQLRAVMLVVHHALAAIQSDSPTESNVRSSQAQTLARSHGLEAKPSGVESNDDNSHSFAFPGTVPRLDCILNKASQRARELMELQRTKAEDDFEVVMLPNPHKAKEPTPQINFTVPPITPDAINTPPLNPGSKVMLDPNHNPKLVPNPVASATRSVSSSSQVNALVLDLHRVELENRQLRNSLEMLGTQLSHQSGRLVQALDEELRIIKELLQRRQSDILVPDTAKAHGRTSYPSGQAASIEQFSDHALHGIYERAYRELTAIHLSKSLTLGSRIYSPGFRAINHHYDRALSRAMKDANDASSNISARQRSESVVTPIGEAYPQANIRPDILAVAPLNEASDRLYPRSKAETPSSQPRHVKISDKVISHENNDGNQTSSNVLHGNVAHRDELPNARDMAGFHEWLVRHRISKASSVIANRSDWSEDEDSEEEDESSDDAEAKPKGHSSR